MPTLSTPFSVSASVSFARKLQYIEFKGADMMADENNRIRNEIADLAIDDVLSYLMALGTVWSDYAAFSEDYMELATDFINGGPALDASELSAAALHKGPQSLKLALIGYRRLRNKMRSKDFCVESVSLEALVRASSYYDSWMASEKEIGKFEGFGPWLFSQIFYSVLIYRNDLWESVTAPSGILLPTGKRVHAQLRDLKKANFPVPLDNVPVKYRENDNQDCMTYAAIEKMAIDYKLNPLKLNAGFFISGV